MSLSGKNRKEDERLKVLYSLKLLDTPNEQRLDEIVKIASLACGVPTALISLVDHDRQWFKAKVGLSVCETPRSVAFCHHAIEQEDLFLVNDASKHEKFNSNPLVTQAPNIRFYAGVPLVVDGFKIGTLCIIDYKPRRLSHDKKELLKKLASQVVEIIKARHEAMLREEKTKDYKELSGVLKDINLLHYQSFTSEQDLLDEYLNIAAKHLGMEFGIVSEIKESAYVIQSCISPKGEINQFDTFELDNTYCEEIVRTGRTVTHIDVGGDPRLKMHPVYLGLGLESYIGSPIKVDSKIVGTINFSSKTPRSSSFRPIEINLLEILAQVIGSRLKIKREQLAVKKKTELVKKHQLDNEILRESSELGLWKWNLKTNEIEYDDRLCEMLGFKRSEVRQSLSMWEERTHPDDKERSYRQMKDYTTGRSDSFELIFRVRHAQGHWVPILSKGKIIKFDKEGQPLIFCGTHFDMSKINETEVENEKLREIANRVQEIAQIGGWRFTIDPQEIIWSPEVYRIHGLPVGSKVDLNNAINFYAPHEREKVTEHMRLAMEKQVPWDGEFEFVDAKNNKKWVRAVGEPVLDDEGKVIALRGYFQDVTETVARQNEIVKLKDLAESASSAKSQFLANMSHELRTPLNAVIGYSELLIEEATPDQKELIADLNKIKGGGKHLLRLINQILDLSKVEAGKMNARIDEFEIESMADEIKVLVGHGVKKNNNNLNFDFSKLPKKINSDQELLKQILINLISNSTKFTKNGKIDVHGYLDTRSQSQNYIFEVKDTGIGIPEEKIPHIFRDFNQADESTTRRFGGTGLGLAICKRFARLLKGSLVAESEVGKGSCFRLYIPAEGASSVDSGEPISLQLNEGSILIIDDEPEAREISRRHLDSMGLPVFEARNGQEGLEMARSLKPSLIILDIAMPIMDGWQVLEELKLDDKVSEIPVIVVSMMEREACAAKLGDSVYFVKPVDKTTLLRTAEKYILQKAS